jgi:predicted TIM-barrel fold metal-dependent hydrolase
MRIDTHAHIYPTRYLDLLQSHGVTTTGALRGLGAQDSARDLDARFALMDQSAVDLQVLSLPPVTDPVSNDDQRTTSTRVLNDRLAELVEQHPHRFRAFATLPLPHLDAALTELDRALDELGMLGVTLGTTTLGRPLTDPALAPLWTELDRRGAVAFLHPSGDGIGSPYLDGPLRWLVGAPVEDTVAAAQLITEGYVTRYPNVRILNSHLGGAVPMLLARWDNLTRHDTTQPTIPPSEAARLMWYDTVCHGSTAALRAAVSAIGADRLILGSDFPYQNGEMYTHGAVGFIEESGLTTAESDLILHRNAPRLFRLPDDDPTAG